VLAFYMGFAARVYVHVERHGVAADGTIFDLVLVRTPGNIHRDHDLFAAGVADIGSFEMGGWLSAAACFLGFLHVSVHNILGRKRPTTAVRPTITFDDRLLNVCRPSFERRSWAGVQP
jgi:hypothetical protein